MAKEREALTATIVGVVITTLDTLLLGGPFLGLLGVLLSIFLSALGWFTGTAIVHRTSIYIDRRTKEYRARLWTRVFGLGMGIFAGILLYIVLIDAARTEYSRIDIAIHLGFVFVFATSIRTMVYAAALAFRSQP